MSFFIEINIRDVIYGSKRFSEYVDQMVECKMDMIKS